MVVGRSGLFRDPGIFWHLTLGEQILDSGEVVRTDDFSFTMNGKPWIASQWLAECVMAVMHRLTRHPDLPIHKSGWDGVLLLSAALIAWPFAWIGSRLTRAGLKTSHALVITWLLVLPASIQFHARPLIATIVLFAVLMAWLVDIEAGRASIRRLWLFVPLCVLWTNLHGGILGGLATMALVFAGWTVWAMFGWDSPVKGIRDVANLAAVFIACSLTIFVNPYGVEMPATWLKVMSMPLQDMILEHYPLYRAWHTGWPVILVALLYVSVLASTWPKRPSVMWLIPLVWLFLTVTRVRHAPLFCIAAGFAMADVFPKSYWAWAFAQHGLLRPGRRRSSGGFATSLGPVVCAMLVLAVLGLQIGGIQVPVIGSGWAYLQTTLWPFELLPELRAIEQSGPGDERIHNDMIFGGFLIRHAPGLRIWIDDRCELYGTEFLRNGADEEKMDEWSNEYGFQYSLAAREHATDEFLSKSDSWVAVGKSPSAVLYRRISR